MSSQSDKPHRYFGTKPNTHIQKISKTRVLHFTDKGFSICLDHIQVRPKIYDNGQENLHIGMTFILDGEIIAEYMNESGQLHVFPITRYALVGYDKTPTVIERSKVTRTTVAERMWKPGETYNVIATQANLFDKGDKVQVVVRKLRS